ncbi:MAG: galactose oxidase-like domain-containing protein [Candidatus Eisenbacteria bacterium]|nr:galactose oxidase-like domain-containing protein [Candidatus Eisenbacteria bacterium]
MNSRTFLVVATLVLALMPPPLRAAPPPVPNPVYAATGYWEAPYDWVTTGAHVSLLPGTDSHSQLLYWYDGTTARVWKWNPGDDLHPASPIFHRPCPSTDIHCAGISLLATGCVLLTGGNDYGPNGLDHINLWDPSSLGWINQSSTLIEPRWYPTQTTLADGRILVTSGIVYRQMVAFGGADDATVHDDLALAGLRGLATDEWVPAAAPGPRPPPRDGHVAVFDRSVTTNFPGTGYSYLQRVVVFGGADAGGSVLGDVWALTRTELSDWRWSMLSPEPDPVHGFPASRRDHLAAYDGPDSSLVIFGGRDGAGLALGDAWKLFLRRGAQGRWSRLAPAGGDMTLPRWLGAGAFDASGRRLFVFGGRGDGGLRADVWQLTTNASPAWTKLNPSGTAPTPREGAVAVYDVPGNRLVIFGGRAAGQLQSDALGVTVGGSPAWSAITSTADPVAGRPSARWRASAVYDDEQRRLVLFGGDSTLAVGSGAAGDLWHLDFRGTPAWKRHQSAGPNGPRAGHTAVLDPRLIHSVLPEIVDPITLVSTPIPTARRWQSIYPAMFLLPSGRLIDAAPEFQTLLLDLGSGTWVTPSWAISGALAFSAVMYHPGRILACGGTGSAGTTAGRWIDLSVSETSTAWQPVTGLVARTTHNLVVVPHGDVYVMGGVGLRNLMSTAVRRPQRWIPGTGSFGDTTELAPDPAVRDYHSSVALLPDGRILSCGGDLKSTPTDRNKYTATIFWPPYLFDDAGGLAPRPVMANVPPLLGYAHSFAVECPQAASIAVMTLIRPAATTHGFDQEQRYVPLSFSQSGPGMLNITTPPSPNHAPPGWYLLFAVDADSVPSVAQWVRLDASVSGILEPGRPMVLSVAPNPARGSVALTFTMAEPGPLDIRIFDAAGRMTRHLYGGMRPGGRQSLTWDFLDDAGRSVATGIYFARIECPAGSTSARIVRVR